MDDFLKKVFAGEVKKQCGFAVISMSDLDRALKEQNTDRVFYSLQSFLIAVGNISKLFWPLKGGDKDRGKELQTIFNIDDFSPLNDRNFRNHFEHFDERLDTWASSSPHKIFIDSCIGSPKKMVSGKGVDEGDYLRIFDPSTFTLTFRGESFNLVPVCKEIEKIRQIKI